jgi:hypothetical protein
MTSERECGPGHPENYKCHRGGDTRVGRAPLAAKPAGRQAAVGVARSAWKHPSDTFGEFTAASPVPVVVLHGGRRVVEF